MGFSKLLRLAAVSATLITQGTLTAQTPGLSHTVAWNNAAVTFIAQTLDVTDTASAAGSLLARWRVGGVDKFVVSKAGAVTAGAASFTTGAFSGDVSITKAGAVTLLLANTNTVNFSIVNLNDGAGSLDILRGATSKLKIADAATTISNDLTVGASTFVVTAATGAVTVSGTGVHSFTQTVDGSPLTITNSFATYTGINLTLAASRAASSAYYFLYATANGVPQFILKGNGDIITTGALAITGALTGVTTVNLTTQPAFVAGDKYLVIDASGNVHVSALGPAS